jgi:glycosyltransferase involved in cell wall biosynthesis
MSGGDVAIQVFRGFSLGSLPYLLYVDTTAALSRSWSDWTPFDEDELGRQTELGLFERALHVFTMGGPAAASLTGDYAIPAERVTAVGGGLNLESLPRGCAALADPVVLFVGRDFRRKGGDCLLEAFRRVRQSLPEARLLIVGTSAVSAEPGIEVLGEVDDRQRLFELYSAAALFCLPSRFEPYGLALIEAMAHGLPCVGTTGGAMEEIVVDGETGVLVPPDDPVSLADTLLALLRDRALAAGLGRAGRARVESELTWDHVVDRMSPVLRELPVGSVA